MNKCEIFPSYHITGVTVRGTRFKLVYTNRIQAMGINLYSGSVWGVRNGKRKLLKRV